MISPCLIHRPNTAPRAWGLGRSTPPRHPLLPKVTPEVKRFGFMVKLWGSELRVLGGIYTYMHTYKHTNIHTYIQTYIHTYIHTYKHVDTHTYANLHIGKNSPDGEQNQAHLDGLGSSKQPHISVVALIIILCYHLLCFRRRPVQRLGFRFQVLEFGHVQRFRNFTTWTSLGPRQDIKTYTPYPIPHAPYLIPHAPCPIPHAPCPVPHAPCPMPHTLSLIPWYLHARRRLTLNPKS